MDTLRAITQILTTVRELNPLDSQEALATRRSQMTTKRPMMGCQKLRKDIEFPRKETPHPTIKLAVCNFTIAEIFMMVLVKIIITIIS